MNKFLLVISCLVIFKFSQGTNYYVATSGSASNSGKTLENAFNSIVPAITLAKAGDTIFVKGGVYNHSTTISIAASGTSTSPICMLAFSGENPVLNFAGTAFGKRGISLTGNYWVIKGFELKNAGDNAMIISKGAYNVIDQCSFHDNKDTGLQIAGGAHHNQIINCDSYFNADPTDYGDADGFAAKMDVGTGNYFYGCRAWFNVDDGWDGYLRGANDVSTTLENCWTWGNGYFKDGRDGGAAANGNGFKMGGSDDKTLKHNFTVINCLAFGNKAKGFDQNSNKGNMYVVNGTSFGNLQSNYSVYVVPASGKKFEFYNCVSYNGKVSLADYTTQSTNSWDLNFTVNNDDFQSIDTTGVSGPRKEDGSLPDIAFMHLNKSSDLIDAGLDLGFPYIGTKPDLGAFEYSEGNGFHQISKNNNPKDPHQLKITASIETAQLKGSFMLAETTTYSYVLFDIRGNKILESPVRQGKTGMNQINVSNVIMVKGIYLFRLKTNNSYTSSKVVVQ